VNTSDSSLLASTVVGDADAFATFYRRHVGAVTGFAVRLGATSDDVADILSETFTLALAGADRYVPMSDSARPWLRGIAWRVAQHGYRRRARQFRLRRKLGVRAPPGTKRVGGSRPPGLSRTLRHDRS
jgi:RNA polymerase sigma-70 factor (ECF subfamily)